MWVSMGWSVDYRRRTNMKRAIIALTILVFFAASLMPTFAAAPTRKPVAKPPRRTRGHFRGLSRDGD